MRFALIILAYRIFSAALDQLLSSELPLVFFETGPQLPLPPPFFESLTPPFLFEIVFLLPLLQIVFEDVCLFACDCIFNVDDVFLAKIVRI